MLIFFLPRRRWRQVRRTVEHTNLRQTLLRAALYLTVVFAMHVAAMMVFEGLTAVDSIWLTLTTVVTVGYGDYFATTIPGRISTVLLIYVGAIFVMFQTAADYFEYRAEKKQRMLRGQWVWNMRDHILILNSPNINPLQYFTRLVDELHTTRQFRDCPVQIVTTRFDDELPEELHDRGVVHYNGYCGDPCILEKVGIEHARAILILAKFEDQLRSDAHTFDLLHRIHELGTRAFVLVESVGDRNIERLREAGADVVLRPIRFYPEIVVRAMVSPGCEHILSNLFTCRFDEIIRIDVQVTEMSWATIVQLIMNADMGTAIAFKDAHSGLVRTNPPPNTLVAADALFLVVREDHLPTDEAVRAVVENGHRELREQSDEHNPPPRAE